MEAYRTLRWRRCSFTQSILNGSLHRNTWLQWEQKPDLQGVFHIFPLISDPPHMMTRSAESFTAAHLTYQVEMTEGSCHHPAPLSSPPMSPGSWHIKGRWRRSSRLCSVILLAAAVALLLVFPCVVFIFKPTWGHGGEAGHRTLPTSVSPSHRGEQAQGVHLRAHAEFFASSPLQHQQLNETLRSLSRGRVLGTLTLAPERQECTRNPLRDKEANNAFTDYEFGCKEISVSG